MAAYPRYNARVLLIYRIQCVRIRGPIWHETSSPAGPRKSEAVCSLPPEQSWSSKEVTYALHGPYQEGDFWRWLGRLLSRRRRSSLPSHRLAPRRRGPAIRLPYTSPWARATTNFTRG